MIKLKTIMREFKRKNRHHNMKWPYYGFMFDDFHLYNAAVAQITRRFEEPGSHHIPVPLWYVDHELQFIGFKNVYDLFEISNQLHMFGIGNDRESESNEVVERWVKTTFPDGGCVYDTNKKVLVLLGDEALTIASLRWNGFSILSKQSNTDYSYSGL